MKYIGGGWVGGGGVGVGGGWEAEGGQHYPQGGKQQCYLFSRHRNCHSQPGGTRQSSAPLSSPISAHKWPHRSCSGPSWFYRVGKRPPVKADLAIYSPINGVSG